MMPWTDERRDYHRVALQWPVAIRRSGEERAIPARTRDLSSGGVYCLSQESFRPGEQLELVLLFPQDVDPRRRLLRLHCRVSVVRSEPVSPDLGYGVACRIEDYQVVVGANGYWFDSLELSTPAQAAAGG